MTGDQIVFLSAAFVAILSVTLLAQFKWLPGGRAGAVIVFAAGVLAVVALRLANLPPKWFSASAPSFALAASFLVGAFVHRTGEGRSFGLPLLLGMGLSLFVANVVALIAQHL